jgi:hypothetical protein
MVQQVPVPRKSITFLSSFAVREQAEIRIVSVVMHSMGLPFMAQKGTSGGEPGFLTVRVEGGKFAFIGPQVGI